MAQPKFVRGPFYRLEQIAGASPTFALNAVVNEAINTNDILEIFPVNSLLGADIGGFPWLYTRILTREPSLNQELYAMQTVLQLETLYNA